jgi:two-component system NtrC family sensor kinase
MDEPIRILCVDDEKSILTAITRSFLEKDYELLNATSGPEGLEILRRVTPIQVVISDFRMPGMNGVDFLKEVCKY